MKKVQYGYDELRRFLVLFGVVLVLGYFILYVIGHWELLVRFWESNSQAEINRVISQLRHKTILNFVVLVILTAVTAAIPFMSNAVFAIFNGVVYGPYIGFGMNLLGNVLGNFIFIKLLNLVYIFWTKSFCNLNIPHILKFGVCKHKVNLYCFIFTTCIV